MLYNSQKTSTSFLLQSLEHCSLFPNHQPTSWLQKFQELQKAVGISAGEKRAKFIEPHTLKQLYR